MRNGRIMEMISKATIEAKAALHIAGIDGDKEKLEAIEWFMEDKLLADSAFQDIIRDVYRGERGAEYKDVRNYVVLMYFAGMLADGCEEERDLEEIFFDPDMFKEYLATELIATDKLEEKVGSPDNVVREGHADLSEVVVFYKALDHREQDGGFLYPTAERIIVPTMLAEAVGLKGKRLIRVARANAADEKEISLMSIGATLSMLTGETLAPKADTGLYVLTGKRIAWNSAATLFYPEARRQIAGLGLGDEFWVLPSSIHEVLLLSDAGANKLRSGNIAGMLVAIVADINATEVKEEERLADNAYRYNIRTGEFITAAEYARRTAEM